MYWNVLKDHRNIQQVILTTGATARWRPTLSPIVSSVGSVRPVILHLTFTFPSAHVPLGLFQRLMMAL